MTSFWVDVIFSLLVTGGFIAAIVVVTWHFSRPKPVAAQRCASCAAGVFHTQHNGTNTH